MNEDKLIRRDRMRFIKNSLSSKLAYLAIILDVLYFVNIYQSDVGTYYYTYMLGISVIYNLIFLLAAFLSSEGVKNYKKSYSYVMIVLGVVQIVRIFILPTQAHTYVDAAKGYEVPPMGDGQFTYLVVLLIGSAVCLVASAVVNMVRCNALAAHMKFLEDQSSEEAKVLVQKSV